MFRASLFLGKSVDRFAISNNIPEIEIDENTDNCDSEHFKSTLFANQLNTDSNFETTKCNKRYTYNIN